MPTIFTRIINREIPAHIIAENDDFIAFLDIHPMQSGHTLVIPKKEVDKIYDHDNETLSKIMLFARPLCHALEKATGCIRVGMLVYGTDVPHTHLHLIPIPNGMHLSELIIPKSTSQEELLAMKDKILANL